MIPMDKMLKEASLSHNMVESGLLPIVGGVVGDMMSIDRRRRLSRRFG